MVTLKVAARKSSLFEASRSRGLGKGTAQGAGERGCHLVLRSCALRQKAGARPFPTSGGLRSRALCLGRGRVVLRGIRCKAHSQVWDQISENRAPRTLDENPHAQIC